MSLRTWLSRPLSRFLKFSWLYQIPLWPAGLLRAREWKPSPKSPPRPPARLGFLTLETRETPDDLLGVLTGGFALGQVALVNGQFPTPLEVFLDGWNAKLKGRVPAQAQAGRPGARPAQEEAARANPAAAAGAQPLTLRKQGQDAAPARPGPGGAERPLGRAAGEGPFGDWLNAVGAFLSGDSSRGKPSRALPEQDSPRANGGGGGGGSGGFTPSASGFSPTGSAGLRRASDPPLGNLPLGPGAPGASPRPTSGRLPPALSPVSPQGGSAGGGVTTLGGEVGAGSNPDDRAAKAHVVEGFARTRLPYELNVGQSDPSVRFLSRGAGFGFWMTRDAMVFSVARRAEGGARQAGRDVFRLRLVGVNPDAEMVGRDPLRSRSNYFVGDDPAGWHSNVPHFGRVEYREAFPGVDLVVRSHTPEDRVFEYDFRLAPGSSPDAVRLRWEGLSDVSVDQQGRLLLRTGGGTVVQDAPVIYQESHGQRTLVPGRYAIRDGGEVGFEVTGEYDRSRTLVIDPVVSFSSYLGGSGADLAYGAAVDAAGNSYVTGYTASSTFPTHDGYDPELGGSIDAFVSKLNARGDALVFSTYLGGAGVEFGRAIAVDLSGSAYVTGSAFSIDFPTTAGAYNTTFTGTDHDAFLVKLGPAGDALSYSTYLGGGNSAGLGVAVDQYGSAYVTGFTGYDSFLGANFPTTGGAYQTTFGGGGGDAFVTKFTPGGDALEYSTYLGGAGAENNVDTMGSLEWDAEAGIAVDARGHAHVTGWTGWRSSGNWFPTTVGAYQTSYGGGASDVFVTELSADGSALIYSTFVGWSDEERGYALALGRDGTAYLTGYTYSSDYPATAGAYPASSAGAFATALGSAGTTLSYSTVLGTSGDIGYGVGVDAKGRATYAGVTFGGFPTYQPFQGSMGGGDIDAFVARLSATGTLAYSSYYGGGDNEVAMALALDPRGQAYVAGWTRSTALPGLGGYQVSNQGGSDAFLAKVIPIPVPPAFLTISSDSGYSSTDKVTTDQTLSITGTAEPLATVTLELTGTGVLGSVAANANGTWVYDYTGTTLPEGTHAFVARGENEFGLGDYSREFPVTVDRTNPDVYLYAPASTPSRGPEVRVLARDLNGVPATATVTLDVDLDNDGNFTDPGESGYATGNLYDGQATIKVPTLPSSGTYPMRARVTDLAGNEGSSSTSGVVVPSVTSAWVATPRVLSADPVDGDMTQQLGDLAIEHKLDLDQSPGSGQGGRPALVYHSASVSQKPIVQVSLPSVNNAALPGTITARLTFNGTAAATVTYSTSGFAPGDVFTLALQASNSITTTGRYGYSVLVKVTGQPDQTVTGATYIVAQDSSPFGAGWSFAGVDRLVSIGADANGPAGMLRVYGSGGWRFYQGTSTFTSPAGDNGTLTLSGSTYTYSTPDGQSWTFNGSGYMTQWTSADAKETLQYRYDGSNRLEGITAIDGGLTTFTYTGSSSVTVQTVNGRTTTLTLSSGNLATLTNPDGGVKTFTYDGSRRMTREEFVGLEANFVYTAAGTLGTLTYGATSVGGVTNLNRTTFLPAATRGKDALVSGTVFASSTDPTSHTTRVELDDRGRTLQSLAPDGALDQYTYSGGYRASHTDPLGRTTTYQRDGSGYVTKTTLPDASVLTYQYQSAFHALTTMVNEKGETTTYAYDGGGHRTRSTDALGNHTTYNYNSTTGLLESAIDALGNRTTQEYDSYRRLTRTTDALGNGTSYTYDANGNRETTTDALANVTTTSYDVMGRVTATTDALDNVTAHTYSAAGLPLTTTDAMGTQSGTVYDGFKSGQVVGSKQGVSSPVQVSQLQTYDDAGRPAGSRNAGGWWTDTAYDPNGRAVSTTDAQNGLTKTVYDLAGQPVASLDEVGRWTHYSYDSRGRVTRVQDNLGHVTTSVYDAAGNLTATTDALNRTTTYQYDALNRQSVAIDPLGRRTTASYDAAGNVSTVTDPMNRVTSFTYDVLNRQTKMTEAVGTGVAQTQETGYDEVGNVRTRKDGLSNVTTFSYDAANRQTEVRDALNQRTTTTYDAVGQVSTVKDPLGQVVTYAYDALHRQVAAQDALSHTATVVLDALGRPAATIDAEGDVAVTAIDSLGRGIGSLDAEGGFSFSQPDAAGGTRLFSDAEGSATRYAADGAGRGAVRVDPVGKATTAVYDAQGQVTSVTDRNGRVIQYSYDAAGRATAATWKSAAGATVNLLTYTYDDSDNVLTASDYAGTVTYTYDELNRVRSYANVFGQVLTYSYDAEGRTTRREDSLGGVQTSAYDAAGQLTSRQFGGAGQTQARVDFGYTSRGEQSSVTRYSDVAGTAVLGTSVYGYDDAGRLTGVVNKDNANATLSYYSYSHDAANRVQAQTYFSQVGTLTYSGTNTYSYDGAGQLTNDGATAYSYDLNGNRTMAGYQTGTANRLTNDGVFTYTYDDEGNLTQKSKGAGLETWYYGYDNANRMTSVRKTSNGSADLLLLTYTYDVEGNRVKEQEWVTGGSTTETRFAFDGEDVWADLSSSNVVETRRTFGDGPDQVLTRTVASGPNAGLSYYQTDGQGSVRDVVDASSQVKAHLEYDGYGVRSDPQGAVSDRYGYTAREWHAGAGLQHNRARVLMVGQGAWMQEDPIGFTAGDANLRRYVGNDPVNHADPDGLSAIAIGGLVFDGGLVGLRGSGAVGGFDSISQTATKAAGVILLIWVAHTLYNTPLIYPRYDGDGLGLLTNTIGYGVGGLTILQTLRETLGIVVLFFGGDSFRERMERAIQEEWEQRGDFTAEAMKVVAYDGPHEMANPDDVLGPNAKRYQASVENEYTGEEIDVSVNYDPSTGKFGTIKPASGRD